MSFPQNRQASPGIPNGWFAVAWSKDLLPGEVKPIHYFGQDLVLFRTRSGQAKVLDAYCAHLGAHLGHGGRVVGEGIRCPFHAWQYDGDGRCVQIPYCAKIPARALVRPWATVEENHLIFVWHHAEGKPPDWDVPRMPELFNEEWIEPRPFELEVPCHMQEMAENNCDPVHFQFVHGMTEPLESDISFGEDGRFFRMANNGPRETPFGTIDMNLERDTWGLGVTSVRLKGLPEAGMMMFSATSPIDERNTISRWIFSTTRNIADVGGEEWIESMSTGVLQDMQIWKNKIYRPDPVLCEADKYLAAFRKWTKQFYSSPPQAD